jgi:acetyl-CoA carboxylase biotin carboxyl carrier protein
LESAKEKKMSWVERVEAVMSMLKGSSIEEIELTEGELKILIRRSPGNIIAVRALQQMDVQQGNTLVPRSTNRTLDMRSPLTGVYYAASSPTSPPFINVGDSITVGQTIALIEAMKVFSEIPSEVSGRVVAIKVQNSDVVKKGDVLFQVEPA